MPQHIGFRCPDELLEAIHQKKSETGKDTSTLIIEALKFWLQNKPVEQSETTVSQSDEHLQELIDSKTQYLATAMNEARHLFEDKVNVLSAEVDELKARLSQQERLLGES
jgi:predicted DNA binding CopG/RHH family protein